MSYAHDAFRNGLVDAIVVLNESGSPVGIATAGDLVTRERDTAVLADVMTSDPATVSASETIARASQLMFDLRIRHLVVIGWGGAVIGILSALDVMRATA